jgi:hypothetical protein
MKVGLGIVLTLVLVGCGGSGEETVEAPVAQIPVPNTSLTSLPLPDNTNSPDYKILFIGNSHTSGNNLPFIVEELINNNVDSTVKVVRVSSSSFLSEHITTQSSLDTFYSEKWTHVILQAQKFSSSQSTLYPTDAAKRWVELTKSTHGATPVFFAEHPQRGSVGESLHIHTIYSNIAKEHPACVAPVGFAWDKYAMAYPTSDLWANDGNHANPHGAHLTALVLYSVITGEKSEDIQVFSNRIDVDLQSVFAQFADQTIAEYQACEFTS